MNIREEVFCETRQDLRQWLILNHTRTDGVWVVFYKKSTGLGDVCWESIVEECLCVGWIDSVPGKVDATKTKIYISPRKPNSGWSRRNKVLLVELEKSGMLTDAGRDAIVRAKANGSWGRFDRAENLIVPDELSDCFVYDQLFRISWDKLSDAKKRQLLQQIYDTKTPPTRYKQIKRIRDVIVSEHAVHESKENNE